MLQTPHKNDTTGITQMLECFSRYKRDEMSIDDKPRSARPHR